MALRETNETRAGARVPSDSERRLAQLAAVVETSGEALISVSLTRKILTWNPAAERLFGYTEAEAVGQDIGLIVPVANYTPTRITQGVLGEGRVIRVRTQRLRKDGTRVEVSVTASPMRGAGGEIIGISSVFRDRTLAVLAAGRQKSLMRELAHRGNNLLAVIQSIARHSLAGPDCAANARDGFISRVASLARIHQTLNAEGFEGAKLSEMVRLELGEFGPRARYCGPDVLLWSAEAQTFGLMLNELAANARRHGALSDPHGVIDARWSVEGEKEDARFRFEWTETGGRPVAAPTRRGFGLTMMIDVVGQSFGTGPRIEFRPGGLSYSLDVALGRIGRRLESNPVRARIRSPRILAFHDAWRRVNGLLPSFEELDVEIRGQSGHFTVATIDPFGEPANRRFDAMSRRLADARGVEASAGDRIARETPGADEAMFRRCARGREPLYELSTIDLGGGARRTFERLFVPCAADGVKVTHVVAMSIQDEEA